MSSCSWIKLTASYWKHKKTIRLCAKLGTKAAAMIPPLMWCYAAQNQPDGNFEGFSAEEFIALIEIPPDILSLINAPSIAQALPGAMLQACSKHTTSIACCIIQALQEVGFLDKMKIHNWQIHNGFHEISHLKAKKAASIRWSKSNTYKNGDAPSIAPSNAQAMLQAMPDKRRKENIRKEEEEKKHEKTEKDQNCNNPELLKDVIPIKPELDKVSDKRKLTDGWIHKWQSFHGTVYKFDGAKDGKAADSLLRLNIPIDQILDIAEKAWGLNGNHDFERGHAIQLSSFASQFNRIRLAVGTLAAKKPAARPFKPQEYGLGGAV